MGNGKLFRATGPRRWRASEVEVLHASRVRHSVAARLALPPVPIDFHPGAETELDELWQMHDEALASRVGAAAEGPGRRPRRMPSLLSLKAQIARRLLRECVFCEHRCGVDRTSAGRGVCSIGETTRLHFAGLLVTEEDEISPSFCLFPSGCNFSCVFCCAAEDNAHPERGEPLSAEALDEWLALPDNAQARTVSLIGGEPTVHLHALLRAVAELRSPLPLAWNSNFYFSHETARLLEGAVDFYIADCHYGSDQCAERLGGAPDHFAVITRNLLWAVERSPLILRHLVLPGHMDCCTRPVLEWAAAHLDAAVHVMCNYVPPPGGAPGELGRALTAREIKEALECASDLGINLIARASPGSVNPRS